MRAEFVHIVPVLAIFVGEFSKTALLRLTSVRGNAKREGIEAVRTRSVPTHFMLFSLDLELHHYTTTPLYHYRVATTTSTKIRSGTLCLRLSRSSLS